MKCQSIIYIAIAFLASMNVCCGGKGAGSNPEESDTVSQASLTPPDSDIPTPARPSSATLLLDASSSMTGYLRSSGDSRFAGVISNFENLPNSIAVRFYSTKEDSIGKDEFNEKLNRGNISWSGESNLIAMVQAMADHVDKKGDDICFLVTDAILSGSNNQIKNSPDRSYNIKQREAMMQELSSKLSPYSGKLSALIVRYKAKFNGRYHLYNNTAVSLVNKDRPFFVVALGKWNSIKYVEQELIKQKRQNGLATSYEELYMIGDNASFDQLKLSPKEGLEASRDGGGKWHVKNKDRQNNEVEEIVFTANINCLSEYMQQAGYFKSNIELYIVFANGSQLTPLKQDDYTINVENKNGIAQLQLGVVASRLNQASSLIFKLKNVKPEWIELYSDDNDSDIMTNAMKVDKTFNLRYFVDGFSPLNQSEYVKEQVIEFSNR